MSGQGRLALGASVVCFIALAGIYFATRVWMPFMWGLVVPGILGLIFWTYYDRKKLQEFFMMKSTKQGLNMGALILIIISLLTIINYLGGKYYKTFDFSGNKINTLSDQTKKLLSSLDSDLIVKYFYKNGADHVDDNKKTFRELIKKYQDESTKVQFEFIEMNDQAKVTQDFGATKGTGEAFLDYKGNKNRIENYTEQDLTNALIKVTRGQKKTVYFLEGHNERNTDQDKDESGLSGFKQMLQKNSYLTKNISLTVQPEISKEADALLILAPTQNFQSFEIKTVENYLEKGGSVFLALENRNTAGLQALLSSLGIELENFYVFNVYSTPMGQVVNAQSPTVAVNYSPTNSITKVFGANQMTVFNQPNALKITKTPESMQAEVLVKTPPNSVALVDLNSKEYLGNPQAFNLGIEIKGKYKKSDKEFTFIVFSDVDFMSNLLLYQNLNRDLALNSIAALVKETDLISVSPKEPAITKLLLSPPEFNQFFKFVVLGLFFPLPIVFMGVSLVLWIRRRHA